MVELGPVEHLFFTELILPDLLKAAGVTLVLTFIAMPIAVAAGLVLALMRMNRRWWLRVPATVYIEIMRGTPLLVQLYLVYFTLARFGQAMNTTLLTWDNFTVGIFCLAANYAAYEAEVHRAGIQAIDRGQREAALSIGMSEEQAFLHVTLPQAFRIILPPVMNDLIAMLKDSCLVSVIGVSELLSVALGHGKSQFTVPQMLTSAAVIYLVLSLACALAGRWLERRLHIKPSQELQMRTAHGH